MSGGERPALAVTRDQIRDQAEREYPEWDEAALDAHTDRVWDRVLELDELADVDVCRAADGGEAAADFLFHSWPEERRRAAAAAVDDAFARSWAMTKPGRRRR